MSKRDTLAALHLIKAEYVLRSNRSAGWDRRMMAQVMKLMIDHVGGWSQDDDLLHLGFLDAMIDLIEAEDAIAKVVNRVPVKLKVEELA